MNTRLDRLFALLDQGGSLVTKKAAASQLGEVQRSYPDEFARLLRKLRPYLHSSCWDTRIAAGAAVEAIVKHVPKYFPSGQPAADLPTNPSDQIRFEQFSVETIARNGTQLLGSEGSEYDVIIDAPDIDVSGDNDRLLTQRRWINKRLGLDIAQQLQLDLDPIITNDDLKSEVESSSSSATNGASKVISSLIQASDQSFVTGKRYVDDVSYQKSIDCKLTVKRIKKEKNLTDLATEPKLLSSELFDYENCSTWPLQAFAEQLLNDLFHPSWEVRHGSATALRELIKEHGRCGGRTTKAASDQMERLNQLWLEDVSIRLICVLALDKFGDFLGDQVVAPVRETCAQALGTIFKHFSADKVRQVIKLLVELLKRQEWEARHGALLSIKYLLTIRQDLTSELLPLIFDSVFDCLKDSVDDVSAVAAAALVPVKEKLFEVLPVQMPTLIAYLWDALIEIDELTSSTSSILMLLSSLLGQCRQTDREQLNHHIPRLWPFLDHSQSSVRKSVLNAFFILIQDSDLSWMTPTILSDSMRLLYQRSLIEENNDIQLLLYEAWHKVVTQLHLDTLLSATCQYLSGWIHLMMFPALTAIDSNLCSVWLHCPSIGDHHHNSNSNSETLPRTAGGTTNHRRVFIGGVEHVALESTFKNDSIIKARLQASRFIALLASRLVHCQTPEPPSSLESFVDLLLFHLNSKSALHRTAVSWILQEWSQLNKTANDSIVIELPSTFIQKLMDCLQELLYYDEIAKSFTRIQHETRDFIGILRTNRIAIDENLCKQKTVYPLNQISKLLETTYPEAIKTTKCKLKTIEEIDNRKKSLAKSLAVLIKYQNELAIICSASLASALVAWNYTPDKLNPIVRPLMDSIKKEENAHLQLISAQHLAYLLNICATKNPQPISKIIKNLITYLCSDANFTPPLLTTNSPAASTSNESDNSTTTTTLTKYESLDLITLSMMQKSLDAATYRKSAPARKPFPDTPDDLTDCISNTIPSNVHLNPSDDMERQNEIYRKGASFALAEICKHFGDDLRTKVSPLWDILFSIQELSAALSDVDCATRLLHALQLLEVICRSLSNECKNKICPLFDSLVTCLESPHSPIRHLSSRCFGALSMLFTDHVMQLLIDQVLLLLQSSECLLKRLGAIECLYHVIDRLEIGIVPYISLLVIPMMGRMSDSNKSVRLLATQCFAQLVKLMPLDQPSVHHNVSSLAPELLRRKQDEQRFLEQLLNPKSLNQYQLPIPVKADLRSYQQDGINWLAFLNKYRLHGILCDEMGLGKTLMSICILAADHFYRDQQKLTKLPSLVICPPTLTCHWVSEIHKFVEPQYLQALNYSGTPYERQPIRDKILRSLASDGKYNMVVASFDIVRNDIDFFGSIAWNYCILDEGHIIKNGKTKMAKAIKTLNANHRLILTGTPIQNNVLELWSLFDFLMPGYLGTERQFAARYSKPILASRDAKASSKEQEAGILAMEALHGQVLPFILRRMKEDVLKDLPPKIIQDYNCELSPLQVRLYEDFAKSKTKQGLEISLCEETNGASTSVDTETVATNKHHIFQALQYLKRVCNHPKLVLTPQHPEYTKITASLKERNSGLDEIGHSAKLCALRQLLLDCGIGLQSDNCVLNSNESIISQHRALIFCQMKAMLDIVEKDLLKSNMSSVTYLRLDGSVPVQKRQSIVNQFNNDPSIDVLLLTTQVSFTIFVLLFKIWLEII